MTDAKAEALRTLAVYKDWPYGINLSPEDRSSLLSHIADLEARAERAEKENAELRTADRDHMSAKRGMEHRLTARAESAEAALAEIASHDLIGLTGPASIVAEAMRNVAREALAASPASNHPENHCGDCGRPNPSWFAPNDVWNTVMGGPNGIICPVCFIARAERADIVPAAWVVQPEPPPLPDLRAENEQLRHDIERATETNSGLATENERLRALLREIKRDYSLAVSSHQHKKAEAPHWAARLAAQQQIEGSMRMIARIDAALEGK